MKAGVQNLLVEEIPVTAIQPSPTNPRKHYDQPALEELAGSIRSVGVQVPLSLRIRSVLTAKEIRSLEEVGGRYYEIVGGERRWRAAQIAGLSSVPAIARVMTDAECRESQLVDNLQRADLTPMEEAEGYELLIARALEDGFEISDERLAQKVGKLLGHVRSRRKLLDLIPEARTALSEGVLSFGGALLIAKLLPADQEKATVRALMQAGSQTAAEALAAVRAERADDAAYRESMKAKGHALDEDEMDDRFEPISERELKGWIEDNVLLDLAKANWPLDADWLLPDVPACVDCPKRSGADQALFAELTAKQDLCTDPQCFAAKRVAFVKITTAKAKDSGKPLLKLSRSMSYMAMQEGQKTYKQGQWLPAKPESCPHVQQGITDEGEVQGVCIEPKCKVHKHTVQAAPRSNGNAGGKVDWEAQQKKQEESRKSYVAKETPIRMAVREAIVPKLKGPRLLRAAARGLMLEGRNYAGMAVLRGLSAKGWEENRRSVIAAFEKAKDADLEGWVIDALMAGGVVPHEHMHDEPKRDREDLWALGKLVGVDCDAIAKKHAPPVAKAKPAAAKPAAAKKAVTPKPAKKRAVKQLSAEGRKRIAEAMKKRWAGKGGGR